MATIGRVTVDHYENFPVASWLCPPHLRSAVAAIYAFARTADDLADEGDAPPEQRLADLKAYERDLRAIYAGGQPPSGRWPDVFAALARAIESHQLPRDPLLALLSAFEQDAGNPHYDTYGALLDYCSRSANPVGRLMLHLYAIDDAASLRQSDDICTALQLINFWQDLSVDQPRGRNYLPHEVLRTHELQAPLPAGIDARSLAPVVHDLCDRARHQMLAGAPLSRRVPGRAGWELRLVVQGGLAILRKIERMNYQTLQARPRLRTWDAPGLAWRALAMTA